ncbi:hypothetical protein C1645_824461 [Glomus cerebriforme]|uniref:Uncharacterized protein n=1 Tax=Glomus cerebriforme TaxID=658196 RepID=A0A397SYJ9_9GLOM|nr:hypothetical protein C1645_824461 [Glomus cerebriforme]
MANINTEMLTQFYGMLLYKKKDIVTIQECQAERKLGILPLVTIGGILEGPGNANKLEVPSDSELMRKTLADLYELLLELVGDLILIQENLNINGNPVLEVEYRSNEASANISFGEIFNLLMYLEDNIIAIQEELGIIGYSNQKRAEEADKISREYL